MIALRLLLGKSGAPSSPCTYHVEHDHHDRAPASEADYRLQKTLDENTLQRLLIDELQAQLQAQSAYIQSQQQEHERGYAALHERVAQLESRLTESESRLAASIAAHDQAKSHIAALQQQRTQLVAELEQMEDGFQSELTKVNVELKSWQQDLVTIDERATSTATPSQSHTRTPSSTSSSPSTGRAAILTASLERAKSATRIWALEDEVDRVRQERDALRRRLNTGRASLMQLKQQASQAQGKLGKGRGLNKSESNLKSSETSARTRGMSVLARASDAQLNTRVRPPIRGEPLTPETSDDNRSIDSHR
ncbi:filament domain protein [Ceratobasidium sp. AG-Ba]|nr:filament domain protein [Ceratobasidium sp. AG-Ba]